MRILIATTNADSLNEKTKTGLWLSELAEPYTQFLEAGASILVASPKGGRVPLDPKTEPSERDQRKWPETLAALEDTHKLQDLSAEDFDALYIPGGHGPMMDLVGDEDLQRLITDFDREGKPIAAVCHGPAALLDADGADGAPILAGKHVTGFSNAEELLAFRKSDVPFLLEDELRARGARYEHAILPMTKHVVRDDNLITGQNPASAKGVAEELLDQIERRTEWAAPAHPPSEHHPPQ